MVSTLLGRADVVDLDGSPRAVAARAAALVAVLGPGAPAASPAEVADILLRHGEPGPVTLTSADLAGLRRAARALWPVFGAASAGQAAGHLNEILRAYAHPPRLSCHDGTAWHLHADGRDDGPWAEWFACSSALALATLLAERQANPAGLCASPACGRPFIDSGQGAPRRYCSPRCASRERVAAHRARARQRA
jgi:CGNR zinc finger